MRAFSYLIVIFLVAVCNSHPDSPHFKTKKARALGQTNEPSAQLFTADPSVGHEVAGSSFSTYQDSDHFRFYTGDLPNAGKVLRMLEGVYACFVTELGWRSPGLSNNLPMNAKGPFKKTNVYSDKALISTPQDGYMGVDTTAAMSWLAVSPQGAATGSNVHEYGHALHFHQKTWIDQERTGAWWETVAQWVSDTYSNSPICKTALEASGQQTPAADEMDFDTVIGNSFQVIVDTTSSKPNQYSAWPFFTYITNNPDGFTGLGRNVMLQLMVQYPTGSNETPLHTLQRVSTSTSVAKIVAKYWARMAYIDIGHPQARALFFERRSQINYANVDPLGSGGYRVKSDRKPRYMACNIIPLKNPSGKVTVNIQSSARLISHLVALNVESGAVRYVELVQGQGTIEVAQGEEASLVVANTPATLILYDPAKLTPDVNTGADYSFTLSGATA